MLCVQKCPPQDHPNTTHSEANHPASRTICGKPKPNITPRAKFRFCVGGSSGPKGPVIDLQIFGEGFGGPPCPSREGLGLEAPNPCQLASREGLGGGANPCPFASREGLGGGPIPCPFASREGSGVQGPREGNFVGFRVINIY